MDFIKAKNAPAAIGPYSQAVKVGNLLYISGQIPINPKNGELILEPIEKETEQVLNNLKAIVEEAGGTLSSIVKTTVMLTDMSNFATMNAVYEKIFKNHKPARAAFAVKELPKGVHVEIEAVAYIE